MALGEQWDLWEKEVDDESEATPMLKIFFALCAILALFLVIRPDLGARWAYNLRKTDWHLTENSLPLLRSICRYWNLIMFAIFCYLLASAK